MLPMKEARSLVKPVDQKYSTTDNSIFDIQKIESTDRSKALMVDFDPISKAIFMEILLDEQSLLFTLNAPQAVHLGRWLIEAGDIVNFIQQAGIQFQVSEEDSADES